MEQVFDVRGSDPYPPMRNLLEVFEENFKNGNIIKEVKPNIVNKEEAEKYKTTGNDFMRTEKYQEAIDSYTKAISFDSTNPVYYSNRAAAYSKANLHEQAISDCDKALIIDSSYSKAYGRKGLALSSLNKFKEAVENYKKALELDPQNESYKQNLVIAETKAKESDPGASGMNFANILSNPAIMNMASQFMQNSEVQNLMQGVMHEQDTDQNLSFERLLNVGQQMARQIQETNPELISELRGRMQNSDPEEKEPKTE
ncbi:DgyrCDS4503 [Dimorphilus gyrociliatus]|uniref:DgyrCDS4503 n=1 Tax=Dimorphilus gyrociliatus TaxID=2664684 RepID=A0A7I8VGR4_9ANNE|nr:DgyrCDS4503 [Dimorphilus gyrociliatus]